MASEGMNQATLIGRLDGDPHFKVTEKGRARLWMRVHCVEELPDENGIPRERQTWISVVLWGRRAEALAKFLRAGRRVCVVGSITHWKREGEEPPRWETQIVARDLLLLDDQRPSTVVLRPPAAEGGGTQAA